MAMKNKYSFLAVFNYSDDGISISFPDLPGCLPYAQTDDEAFTNAKEALALHLYGMECDKEEIPAPTKLQNLKLKKNEVPVKVEVLMSAYREKMNAKFIKKTLSIPNWLNTLAVEEDINFSQVLQNALIEKLQINQNNHS